MSLSSNLTFAYQVAKNKDYALRYRDQYETVDDPDDPGDCFDPDDPGNCLEVFLGWAPDTDESKVESKNYDINLNGFRWMFKYYFPIKK